MSAIKITKENYDSVVKNDKPLLIDFYADWCGPCRMLSPTVDKIAAEREDIVVGKVNVDDEPELAEAFGVSSIPTLVVMKSGNVAARSVGVSPKAKITAMLDN